MQPLYYPTEKGGGVCVCELKDILYFICAATLQYSYNRNSVASWFAGK